MKRVRLPLYLLGISALLAGCNSGEKTIADASQKVERQESIVVEYINEVASEESRLHNLFSKTLTEDKELQSMKDSSSTVFKNIDNRRESLELIEEATTEIFNQAKAVKDLKVKGMPEKDIKAFQKKSEEVAGSLTDWTEDYEENLEKERMYFQSLSSDIATYETFSEGIAATNKRHKKSNENLSVIEQQLLELSSARNVLSDQLENKED